MTEFSYPLKVYLLIGLFGLMTLAFSANRLAEAQAYRDDYPFRTQYARLARAKAMLSGERIAAIREHHRPAKVTPGSTSPRST
ncbi:MAG: hypothetical protein U5J83_15975 [Bryobacterales bacterium]|nr:hypothetical protein [Bryobacterales bacterium]